MENVFSGKFGRLAIGSVEALTLLAALAFTIPALPSTEDPISLMPAAAFAGALFGTSRAIRHFFFRSGTSGVILWLLEVGGFVTFAFLNNRVANMLAGHT